MDNLIATGQVSSAMLAQFHSMGYMDLGRDGLPHFHSSPRFLQVLTNNFYNGNAAYEPWDVMRKYGVLPWTDLPYTAATTQVEYLAGISPENMAKAAQFLALIGGKDSFEYHWIFNDTPRDDNTLAIMRQQAPLMFGIAVVVPEWNQVTPVDPPADATPVHCVMNYDGNGKNENILDHYSPYEKVLDATYPVKFVFQGIVTLPAQQIIQTTTNIIQQVATAPISKQDKSFLLTQLLKVVQAIKNIFA
jgi:hypothetical protein